MTPSPITIAHQLSPGDLLDRLRTDLPSHVNLVALTPDARWNIPVDAQALIVAPGPHASGSTAQPLGWPFGLKWIQFATTGIDGYPAWLFDVPTVTCARGANALSISEFALAAMLAFEKRIPEVWIKDSRDWRVVALGSLYGKTLGLVGLGALGTAVAMLALPFGMKVLAHRRTPQANATPGIEMADLKTVISRADHLVLAAPLTAATRHIIGAQALTWAKPTAHLVNVSRGGLIDQDALLAALNAERLAMASLDTVDPEPLPAGHAFYTHPKIRLSPHISWSGAPTRLGAIIIDNVQRFISGQPLIGRVSKELGY